MQIGLLKDSNGGASPTERLRLQFLHHSSGKNHILGSKPLSKSTVSSAPQTSSFQQLNEFYTFHSLFKIHFIIVCDNYAAAEVKDRFKNV